MKDNEIFKVLATVGNSTFLLTLSSLKWAKMKFIRYESDRRGMITGIRVSCDPGQEPGYSFDRDRHFEALLLPHEEYSFVHNYTDTASEEWSECSVTVTVKLLPTAEADDLMSKAIEKMILNN